MRQIGNERSIPGKRPSMEKGESMSCSWVLWMWDMQNKAGNDSREKKKSVDLGHLTPHKGIWLHLDNSDSYWVSSLCFPLLCYQFAHNALLNYHNFAEDAEVQNAEKKKNKQKKDSYSTAGKLKRQDSNPVLPDFRIRAYPSVTLLWKISNPRVSWSDF